MEIHEKNQVLFLNLIAMFHSLAWQQLGKIANPLTNKVERNLDGARGLIDTLEMLKVKTDGHLSADESRFLNETLKELRLNFVDEANKAKEKPTVDGGGEKTNNKKDEKQSAS